MPFPTQFSAICALPAVLFALHNATPLHAATIALNEFVSSNGETIADEDGDFEDWIELYNHGDDPVDLAGFGISDDPYELSRWIFPAVTIEPGEFLIVWASGKDRAGSGAPLHTNFQVSSEGETITLTGPDGVAVDVVEPVALPRDHSYGRVPDGIGEWRYFTEPTPGAANTTSAFEAWLEPPAFSREGGFHTDGFLLELSTRYPDATIHYTLDGSEPDPAQTGTTTYTYKNQYPERPGDPFGPLLTAEMETRAYSGPIAIYDRTPEPNRFSMKSTTGHRSPSYFPKSPIFKGTVVRARAVRPDAIPSDIATHTYFVTPEGRDRYSLPVLSVAIPGKALYDYERGIAVYGKVGDDWREQNPNSTTELWRTWTRPGNYARTGRDWEYPGHLEIFTAEEGRAFAQNLGIRVHGGATRAAALKSLRFYARRSYDTDNIVNYPFFNDIFDIYGNPVDRFKRFITRGSGQDHSRFRYRDAFMQALVRPLGLDDQGGTPVIHFINGEFWGHTNVRKRVDRYLIAHRHHIDPDDVAILTANARVKEGGGSDRMEYLSMRNLAEGHDMADPARFEEVADQMDMDNFILYSMSEIYIDNTDWVNNIDYWRKRTPDRRPGAPPSHDGRWRWILFDLDLGFGLYGGGANAERDSLGRLLETESRPGARLLQELIANKWFRNRFINACMDHIATTFQPDRIDAMVDAFNAPIAPYRDGEHRERWPGLMGSDHVAEIKDFGERRPAHMKQHLRERFNLPAPETVTFDVEGEGSMQINTIHIDAHTPGLANPVNPFPFSAEYFPTVPVEVTAHPQPGHRFAGWVERPEHDEATIAVEPHAGLRLTARFEESHGRRLLAYWNFNDTDRLFEPAYTATGSLMAVGTGPESEVTDGGGNGFVGSNSRDGDAPGRHLRINNPIGATVELRLPTTGHRDPVLTYETRRSGSGAGVQLVEFSRDGVMYEEFFDFSVHDDDPVVHQFDFSGVAGAEDNPYFRVRISFLQGAEGGLGGNNRIDNITFEAVPISGAPAVEHRFGLPVTGGRIETGAYLGSLDVADSLWAFSYRLNNWIYLDPMHADLSRGHGNWAYVLNPGGDGARSPASSADHRYGYPVADAIIDTGSFLGHLHTEFAPWVFNYRLSSWIYLPDPGADLRAAPGAWVYLPRPPDPDALTVSSVSVQNITSDSAQITWTTNRPATGRVHYGTDPDRLLQVRDAPGGPAAEHAVSLTGLSPNRTHYFRVVSIDASNNTAAGERASFQTEPVPLLTNSDFSSFGSDGLAIDWNLLVHGQTDYVLSEIASETGSAQRIEILSAPSWGLVFYQEPPFQSGRDYVWTIRYRVDSENPISATVSNPPFGEVAFRGSLPPTGGAWEEVVFEFTWDNPEANQLRVSSSSEADFAIDHMTLEEG